MTSIRNLMCKILRAIPNELAYNTIEEMPTKDILEYVHGRYTVRKANFMAFAECDDKSVQHLIHCTAAFKLQVLVRLSDSEVDA